MNNFLKSMKNVEPQYYVAGIAVVFLIVDTFIKPLSVVSLCLIALGLSPWLVRFIKKAKLPGGTELEFQDHLNRLTEDAQNAGLLVEITQEQEASSVYEELYDDDPVLALAKLRIELERRLVGLASSKGINRPRKGVIWLTRELMNAGILSVDELHVIADLVPLLNSAVHAEEFSDFGADWAIHVGPKLIAALDKKIEKIGDAPRSKS